MKHRLYPRRDPISNYFPLPNELFSLGLSTGEISVYSYLLYCENRITYQCYPSYRTIGRAIGASANSVRKYVRGLEGKHLITTEPTTIRTRDGRRRNGSLLYTIRPIRDAVDYFHNGQMLQFEAAVAKQRAADRLSDYDRAGDSTAPRLSL